MKYYSCLYKILLSVQFILIIQISNAQVTIDFNSNQDISCLSDNTIEHSFEIDPELELNLINGCEENYRIIYIEIENSAPEVSCSTAQLRLIKTDELYFNFDNSVTSITTPPSTVIDVDNSEFSLDSNNGNEMVINIPAINALSSKKIAIQVSTAELDKDVILLGSNPLVGTFPLTADIILGQSCDTNLDNNMGSQDIVIIPYEWDFETNNSIHESNGDFQYIAQIRYDLFENRNIMTSGWYHTVYIEERERQVVYDSDGNPVLDNSGQPTYEFTGNVTFVANSIETPNGESIPVNGIGFDQVDNIFNFNFPRPDLNPDIYNPTPKRFAVYKAFNKCGEVYYHETPLSYIIVVD